MVSKWESVSRTFTILTWRLLTLRSGWLQNWENILIVLSVQAWAWRLRFIRGVSWPWQVQWWRHRAVCLPGCVRRGGHEVRSEDQWQAGEDQQEDAQEHWGGSGPHEEVQGIISYLIVVVSPIPNYCFSPTLKWLSSDRRPSTPQSRSPKVSWSTLLNPLMTRTLMMKRLSSTRRMWPTNNWPTECPNMILTLAQMISAARKWVSGGCFH